jgi:hypothetical protein
MKLLALARVIARLLVVVGLALQITGCGVQPDKQQALYTKLLNEAEAVVTNMEAFKLRNGRLPTSLGELAASEPALTHINLAAYTYNSNGIPAADGSLWLLSRPDPTRAGRVIVGRLPIEVLNVIPANPQGGASGRQPSGSDMNRTSAPAASRRSP